MDKDAMVKSLRDLFRRKSSCEGQILETNVLINEVGARESDAIYPAQKELLSLLTFLKRRRENLTAQITPINEEIAAIKDALKGTDY